ncbi:hypothetical protein QYC27_05020 [Thermosynechococcus sp. PP45]|uniref:hypothetical protein n=1 Tax=unclassified Thermosynechococcus TaxID=2622553 RepID=UPI0026736205|nr:MULTISPECIES: hypothetical protein [unclassified Thermosynechococcus]MDR7921599.1 hypothetical protein [Thermosynechococcus sp. HY213]WKT82162.1 hypothetical protein QYC27_05020 [Thermosynechococcus sp. PP45]WNC25780.1 hypothetical protein RHH26_05020 [Thermosynechococcus sp. PP551]WNC28359.1 hypothetical protein RHH27_05015 [Thermosynechococcus sp. PP555]
MMTLRWQPLVATTVAAILLPLTIAPAAMARPGSPSSSSVEREARSAFRDLAKAQYEGMRAKSMSGVDASLLSLGDRLLASAQQLQQSGNYFQAKETAKAATRIYEAARNLGEARTGQADLSRSYFDAPFQVSRELTRTEAEMAYFRGGNPTVRDLFSRAQQLAQPASLTAAAPTTANVASLATHRAAVQLLKASRHLMRAERGF